MSSVEWSVEQARHKLSVRRDLCDNNSRKANALLRQLDHRNNNSDV
jgi:hypothetical protein